MKNELIVWAIAAYWIVFFCFIGPWLISSAESIGVATGFLLLFAGARITWLALRRADKKRGIRL